MRKATTYSAIEFRRGSALLAKECVADLISQQLDDHQWILESAAPFETSLSRIQHDALDIAIGFGHEKVPGRYVDETLDWARGNMCGLYKFKIPAGFLNIAFWPNDTTFIVAGIICLLGSPTPMEYETPEKGQQLGGNMKVIECIYWLLCWIYNRNRKGYARSALGVIRHAGNLLANQLKSVFHQPKKTRPRTASANGRPPQDGGTPG